MLRPMWNIPLLLCLIPKQLEYTSTPYFLPLSRGAICGYPQSVSHWQKNLFDDVIFNFQWCDQNWFQVFKLHSSQVTQPMTSPIVIISEGVFLVFAFMQKLQLFSIEMNLLSLNQSWLKTSDEYFFGHIQIIWSSLLWRPNSKTPIFRNIWSTTEMLWGVFNK